MQQQDQVKSLAMCRRRIQTLGWRQETKGCSSRKAGSILWDDKEASAPPPGAASVVFPAVIPCKMHVVLAAGLGPLVCFCHFSATDEVGIAMTPGAAGATLPLVSCGRHRNIFRYRKEEHQHKLPPLQSFPQDMLP